MTMNRDYWTRERLEAELRREASIPVLDDTTRFAGVMLAVVMSILMIFVFVGLPYFSVGVSELPAVAPASGDAAGSMSEPGVP